MSRAIFHKKSLGKKQLGSVNIIYMYIILILNDTKI